MDTAYVSYEAGQWRARWYCRDEGRHYALTIPKLRDGGYTFTPRLREDFPHVKRSLERRGFKVVRVE